jgi:hypothetical protein
LLFRPSLKLRPASLFWSKLRCFVLASGYAFYSGTQLINYLFRNFAAAAFTLHQFLHCVFNFVFFITRLAHAHVFFPIGYLFCCGLAIHNQL